MANWDEQFWESTIESGLPRRARRSGAYRSYNPDPLVGSPLILPPQVDSLVAEGERAIRSLASNEDLAGIARFLLRSEAIASSLIEGYSPSTRQVAFAELEGEEGKLNASDQARLVVRNMTVVEEARKSLVEQPFITADDLIRLQAALLADSPELTGLRRVQNWIGGDSYTPLDAEFVPPSPDRIAALLKDLVDYANGAAHSPIIQAALVHAQLETIHPFADGNGRVGRALIHTILMRRGLTEKAVLPISQVLSTTKDEYIAALEAYHYTGEVGGPQFHEGRMRWIEFFARTALTTTEQARLIGRDLARIRDEWDAELALYWKETGRRRAMRSDSASARILSALPSTPVLTSTSASRIHNISNQAAHQGLLLLTEAGVLDRREIRGKTFFSAPRVLELVDLSTRRLASTAFDTRVSPPVSPVPVRP
ncbi:Fic family protein [Schaalia hyovaginalis]|uniref:Fic family protein n=1 Tax=Schaalia hyovaginalis TaxID=29316 RepID=UPI0026F0FA13|nr:Fic family protein [Schaalia hyovaginalis]MCI6411793.1 Fic family protein [Schaalia hyovaginalis]